MRYRIKYADDRRCSFASSREDLLRRLKQAGSETISDIRKLYKTGVSDSVMEKYKMYMKP